MNESELRAMIQWRVRLGRLPGSAEHHRLFGGSGAGGPCACCGETIPSCLVQFEIECDGSAFLMHLRCYDEWCKASEPVRQESRAAV